jgi:hypothetical protein
MHAAPVPLNRLLPIQQAGDIESSDIRREGKHPMSDIYTKEQDEPSPEKRARWDVYRSMSTGVCCVADHTPAGHTHKYGPNTWQQCWAYMRRSCRPDGGVFSC